MVEIQIMSFNKIDINKIKVWHKFNKIEDYYVYEHSFEDKDIHIKYINDYSSSVFRSKIKIFI